MKKKRVIIISGLIVLSLSLLTAAIYRTDSKLLIPDINSENDLSTYKAVKTPEADQLTNEINSILENKQGTFGIWIEYLESKKSVRINAQEKFYAASLTKVPLLITAYRMVQEGKLKLETKVSYLEADSEWGDGSIQNAKFGTEFKLEEVLFKLAKESDNVAKNMLYRILPWEEIQLTYNNVNVPANTVENEFSTEEMARVWEYLYRMSNAKAQMLNQFQGSNEIFKLLTNTTTEERIPNVVPEEIEVAHKTGTWSTTGSWHDCGIVFTDEPVLVCIMSKGSTYDESVKVIREVTKEALGI